MKSIRMCCVECDHDCALTIKFEDYDTNEHIENVTEIMPCVMDNCSANFKIEVSK